MTVGSPYPSLLVNPFRGCLNAQKKFKIFPFWQLHVTKGLLPSKTEVELMPVSSLRFFISSERRTGPGNEHAQRSGSPGALEKCLRDRNSGPFEGSPKPENNKKNLATPTTAEYIEFRHRMQRYAATECNVMPPLDWLPGECSKSHPPRRRAREIRTWSKPRFSGPSATVCG
jgi:hypothetical protein